MNRRRFLATTAAAGVAAGLSARTASGFGSAPKRLLVLGGTGFIGPSMVRYAVERGHDVTIFTRGNRESTVPGVEHLVGDRNDDLSALEGRDWDVVLDNNARDYRWVVLTTELLKDRTDRYVFVSSISAYQGEALGYENTGAVGATPAVDIGSPLVAPPAGFSMGDELPYGATKALAESIVADAFPGRATIVRPGFIVGPGDPTDRFTYWPARIDQGGEVLAPGDGTDPVQLIDVRDLTEWMVRLAESGRSGEFNAVGPAGTLTMAGMVYGVRAVSATPAEITWVPIPFLQAQDVRPYSDMPIWIPNDPLSAVGHGASIEAGLTFRPLAVTAGDTLDWFRQQGRALEFGISRERERAVLAAWRG